MSPLVPVREDLTVLEGYHSAQVPAKVRLNTNESPFPPPETWREQLADAVAATSFNRYPDREASRLRAGVAALHDVRAEEVFCANGSNEVLQCLLLAYGGPGRSAATFEPTYALHSHIARVTGTTVVSGGRCADFTIDGAEAIELVERAQPVLTFVCSPNNPTGRAESLELIAKLLAATEGLVVVDEAYGQFAPHSALELREQTEGLGRLVVVRTFSKTWSMAAARLGYLVADPEVVAACMQVALPYHLSAVTQEAGRLALTFVDEMEARVAIVAEERGRLFGALAELAVEVWPSDANFLLFRPTSHDARKVWESLVERSVLIRDCSSWPGLEGCLRVTVGSPSENALFLGALRDVLGATERGETP
jgi:histidinol-phosphate aminotransferase